MNAEATFRAKAPGIMAKLLSDFPIGVDDAAAVLGNVGHECAGFTAMQEFNPVVAGSKGGWGWRQWAGPRRRAFEAYCKRNGKDPASDEANYAYLFIELKGIEGSEKAAIPKTIAAKGLDAKVIAFELAFLRAGVKHYSSRQQWARVALDAWKKAGQPASLPSAPEIPRYPEPPAAPLDVPPRTIPASDKHQADTDGSKWPGIIAIVIIILIALAIAGAFF
ncbi:phage tail tip lysozyme [Devosia sp. 1566]|uniref:phage tail tip lysozyme n=1 Tax=Devosia sp. 1566 TaxID=2499144 RepID=UPI000FDB35B4|nr:phage tail tip lysozyme [Devosia sp. 1566]